MFAFCGVSFLGFPGTGGPSRLGTARVTPVCVYTVYIYDHDTSLHMYPKQLRIVLGGLHTYSMYIYIYVVT